MEVDQSPEEYFRQHAAAALLRSDADDAADDVKESWSEIEDASGAEDDPAVAKKKRILRYGRNRLSEMRERFNSAKARLFEEKQQQLDLEWAQLQDGTHPQYREFIGQVDARWTDRLDKIDFKLACSHKLAQDSLDSSKRSAAVTFITSRGELRQRMVRRRKRRMWALTDDLRSLERVSEAIESIAKPMSNEGAADTPVRGTAAPRDSAHLLNIPDSRLPKVDEDADVSAIRGIPALLNHTDADLAVPDDVVPGSHVHAAGNAGAAADAVDTRVPGYAHSGYASAPYAYQGAPADTAAAGAEYAYGQYSTTPVPATAAAAQQQQQQQQQQTVVPAQASVQAYYADSSGYRYPQQGYYESSEVQANGTAATNGYTPAYDGRHAYAAGADHHRHSASHSRVSDILRPGEPTATTGAYSANVYYDGQAATPSSAHQRAAAVGKREVESEYDDTPSKRQRMMHQAGTWPPSTQQQQPSQHAGSEYAAQQQQQQDGRAWATDPSTAMPGYGYNRQAYPGQQYPQGEYAYQNAYYGSSKYDYAASNAYYQQQPHPHPVSAYSGTGGSQPRPHYQGADGAYYQSAGQYQQQPQTSYPADYRANGSYSGLDTGITMGQSPGHYAARYPQQQQQQQQGWSEYYQQQPYPQTPGTKTLQYYSRQQPEHYDHAYHAHPQQQQQRVATEVAGGDGHYPSLSNILK